MKKYDFITKRLLYKLYWIEFLPIASVAIKLGCSPTAVRERLIKFNILIRTLSEANKGKHGEEKYIIIKKFLIGEYIRKERSAQQIAKELGCGETTIYRNLKKYNIPRRTTSETQKEHHYSPKTEFKKGYTPWNKNIHQWKNKQHPKGMLNKHHTEKTKEKIGISSKKLWQNKEYRDKVTKNIRKSSFIKPNKPEKQLNKLLQNILPNEYKFVGDGQIIIDGFCPDFINCNGQKKLIELFGDYWHNRKDTIKRDKQRLKAYKKYGYKTLVVWQHELRDLERIVNKIMKFNLK